MTRPLSLTDLAALTALSTLGFLVYPEPLWSAPPGASHLARFIVTYLAVIPLAYALAAVRSRSVAAVDIAFAVLAVWSVKMLLTVGLYHALVPGSSLHLEPVRTVSTDAGVRTQPSSDRTAVRNVTGRWSDPSGGPYGNALVVADGVVPAGPAREAKLELAIEGQAGSPPVGAVHVGGRLEIRNTRGSTVVVRGRIGEHGVFNLPVLPSGAVSTPPLLETGPMIVETTTGDPRFEALVWVYSGLEPAMTEQDGSFVLQGVPEGMTGLRLFGVRAGRLVTARARIGEDAEDARLEVVTSQDAGATALRDVQP